MKATDWDLIQACRQGDERAWQLVIDRYKRLVFSIPLNYGLNQSDAADIVQLTFVMLLQGLDGLHQNSHLGGWLTTVARRNTWHVLRRYGRENIQQDALTEESQIPDEKRETEKERRELIAWLHDGLSRLDETCRAILIYLFLDPDQPSYNEVASRMGLSVGSIGPMRARCLQQLREIMREI